MGQTYDVTLSLRFKDEAGAKGALKDKIAKAKEEKVDYNLDHYRSLGVDTESLQGLLNVFFGGWYASLAANARGDLNAGFDACYGWETLMMDAFDAMAPFLENGSAITIYPDSGVDAGTVADGKTLWN